jgi:hypothetical protein
MKWSRPNQRVIEVNKKKFMSKYGDLDLIWAFLKCNGMDLNRRIECMKDPGNKDVVVFWQSLPNEFLADVEGNIY